MSSERAARLGVQAGVLAATPYVPDWLGLDRAEFLRLDRNESTQPVSGELAAALSEYISTRGVHSYPEAERLTVPLSDYCGVPSSFVVATNGSDQAIDLCLRAFLGPGRRMVVATPEFAVFGHVAGLLGAEVHGVPFDDDLGFPYRQFSSAAATRPDLIVVINPNNPTGTPVDVDYIEHLATSHPDTPVLVDEAYYEFTGATAVDLVASHPNVVVLRTFSKAFAMAGLRLGYVVAHSDIAFEITKLRNPFDVNELAVVAAATQLAHMEPVREHVASIMDKAKPMTLDFFAAHGVPVVAGAANFMLVRPDDTTQAIDALRAAGILVRSMSAPSLAGMFRMSVGTPDEMRTFVDAYATHVMGAATSTQQHPGEEER